MKPFKWHRNMSFLITGATILNMTLWLVKGVDSTTDHVLMVMVLISFCLSWFATYRAYRRENA